MIKFDDNLINNIVAKSRIAERKRSHHLFHQFHSDPLQRMLNSMQPGTYLQPHKHEDPDRLEVLVVLKGKYLVVEFKNNGEIKDHMILEAGSLQQGAEIAAAVFHTVICLEPDSVLYEIKEGPFSPIGDKDFASWAPKEGSPQCDGYLQNILDKLAIGITQ